MTDLKTKSQKTRNRLLTAASRIFAEKGFQESTIAEICEQADSNIASVNYHFRDKETLYDDHSCGLQAYIKRLPSRSLLKIPP